MEKLQKSNRKEDEKMKEKKNDTQKTVKKN